MEYLNKGDEFFIIIKGVVSVQIPNNTTIKDWAVKKKDYKMLQEWKRTVFDIKAQEVQDERSEKYQVEARKKQDNCRRHSLMRKITNNSPGES